MCKLYLLTPVVFLTLKMVKERKTDFYSYLKASFSFNYEIYPFLTLQIDFITNGIIKPFVLLANMLPHEIQYNLSCVSKLQRKNLPNLQFKN